MSIRVYVPLTSRELARLVQDRRLPGPRGGHAVTDALRAAWADGDDEQWEYAATYAAAEDSWSRRGDGDRPRRHVLAVDAASVETGPEDAITAVRIPGEIAWPQVAAAHVDTVDLTDGADEELAWFARQEIPDLVDG